MDARSEVDPRLAAALGEQLERRRALLRRGAGHIGWKLGMGERESIGGEIAVGHLTSATQLEPGSRFLAGAATDLRADAEVAIKLRRDVDAATDSQQSRQSIAGSAAALEIVDLAPLPDEPHSVVAANVFHRAAAFGGLQPELPNSATDGTLLVNGTVQASARAAEDLIDRIRAAARLLEAVGERLRDGDWIITGSIVQAPISVGDQVDADLGVLGTVRLWIAD